MIRSTGSEPVAAPRLIALVAALIAVLIVVSLVLAARGLHPKSMVPAHPGPLPTALIPSNPISPLVAANGWIAYSTSGHPGPSPTELTTGSDIYLVRAGVEPRLIAGRDGGKTWNVCPAFSPDGRRLAYGVDSKNGRFLVVVGVDPNGVITATVRLSVLGSRSAVCPRWSADGTRVAYLDSATVVVRGLDGSTLPAVAGDPQVLDFGLGRQFTDPLLSPKSDRIVRLLVSGSDCHIVVAKPDGTAAQVIPMCGYALATWSPDGRQAIVMEDIGGAFTMQAIAVDSPFAVVTIVSNVATNGQRSMPGWDDVSWQPVLP